MEKKPKTITKKNHVGKLERFTYGIYFVGQNIIYNLVFVYLLIYYTDFALVPIGATVILTTVTKIWDAVNDPIFGSIVDNVELKWGKFKPWIFVSSILLPFATLLLFIIPSNFSPLGKIIFASVTYFFWDITYTISDVPAHAISTVMTDNIEERNKLMLDNRLGSGIGVLIAFVAIPILFNKVGPFLTVLPIVIFSFLTMLPVAFTAQERFVTKKQSKDGSGLKEMFNFLKNNKYLFIFYAAVCLRGIFKISLNNHIAIVLFNNLEVSAIIGMASMLPMLIPFMLTTTILKHIDKVVLYRINIIATMAVGVIFYFVGYNGINAPSLPIYILMTAIGGIPEGFINVLMFTFSSDCIEYGQYVSGTRKEGIVFSIQTFSVKLYTAGAISLTALVLSVLKYQPNLGSYPVEFSKKLWFANFILPFIGSLISLPLLYKFKLTENDVQIMANINTGKITRDEGNKLLSQQYK